MVEKVIIQSDNVVDLARYQHSRNAAAGMPAMSVRTCRHCGAALLEGESEDECSSTFNIEAASLGNGPRKFCAD
jgi:hypothetical protein